MVWVMSIVSMLMEGETVGHAAFVPFKDGVGVTEGMEDEISVPSGSALEFSDSFGVTEEITSLLPVGSSRVEFADVSAVPDDLNRPSRSSAMFEKLPEGEAPALGTVPVPEARL
ncbi:hypothetical protein B0J11DRAFT_534651 [Dendryphion nanum]|uniref:Uncharacterized protein n=1 Tax=Dendryphion nanum TaxID=256645 RepID=A0A9P9DIG8_9PLEO|nr:hypothetical protein B0J11DRAFT_534651 [Dendryphion nanum]